jgi:tetratricopeptide (TPR) repeat protein
MYSLVILLVTANASFQTGPADALVGERLAPEPPNVIQESPRVMAERNLALSDELRGDIMMARKLYRDAIDFYRPSSNSSAVMANKTGIAYHQLGDLENAKKYYERAIKLNKSYPEAYNNLGTVYYARKSYGSAIKNYEKALALTPGAPSVWTNMGMAYFGRKKYVEALDAYQHALQLDPDIFERRGTNGVMLQERSVEEKAMFYYTLAKGYAKAGDTERMLRCVRFALEWGFKERMKFVEEPVFAAYQENEEFKQLLATEPKVL